MLMKTGILAALSKYCCMSEIMSTVSMACLSPLCFWRCSIISKAVTLVYNVSALSNYRYHFSSTFVVKKRIIPI